MCLFFVDFIDTGCDCRDVTGDIYFTKNEYGCQSLDKTGLSPETRDLKKEISQRV